jgi:HK97 family phage prohead protease
MLTAMHHTEQRSFTSSAPTATGRRVRGYASTFNHRSLNLGTEAEPWHEVIAPGAFDKVLNNDVRALFNHDSSSILARSKSGSGSLRLGVDSVGLWYEFESPDTQVGRDLVTSLNRGDISGSSFSFEVERDSWKAEGTTRIRTIHTIRALFDVGPVTYPAYEASTAAARSRSQVSPPSPTPAEIAEVEHWKARFGI